MSESPALVAGVDQVIPNPLQARLEAAEAVCLMYGWSRTREFDGTDRQLATLQLWNRWVDLVGMDFLSPKQHPELNEDETKALADQRRAIRAETLKKIEKLVVAE